MGDGYRGLPKEDKWGCIIAALIGIPLCLFLLSLDALGDCAPGSDCNKGIWLQVALPALVTVALIFWGVRTFLRRSR